jgi:hypothetical protein
MRKPELTDQLLCQAVQQMRTGLIDADLGCNIVNKRLPLEAEEKVVGYEHGWQQKSQNDGFSFLVSQKMSVPTSLM